MKLHTWSSPHLPVSDSVPVMMQRVLLALVPGTAIFTWLFGWGVIINVLLAAVTALVAEAAILKIRRRPVTATLLDGSALVTGVLLALALPPLAPWWIPVIGSLFAIVIAKQLYGGLGYNPFNPAMAGYVVLLVSFPLELTFWPVSQQLPDFSTTLSLLFTDSSQSIDAWTSATPMDNLKTLLGMGNALGELGDAPLFGILAGANWEWINLAFLAGGLWLLQGRVIQWHIPVSMLAGLLLVSTAFHIYDPDTFATPLFHLLGGATMLGAFFIATDPVSASTTPTGRLWYGFGIGVLTWVIRTWGGYPDGVAFAVLLMNLAAPTIDFYTRPRVFGQDDR